MPNRLQRASERAMIAHTMIDLIRTVYSGRFKPRPGSHLSLGGQVDTLLIAADVLIGHVENRPRNASDIARHLSIPRPTVIRKLGQLVRAGVIRQVEHGRYCTVPDETGASLAYVDASLSIIRRATRR